MRVVQPLLHVHEVWGDDLAANLPEKLGSLVCQAVVCESHFSSAQQLEVVRVMETSFDAAGAIVSQDLRFCVVAESSEEPAEAPQIQHHVNPWESVHWPWPPDFPPKLSPFPRCRHTWCYCRHDGTRSPGSLLAVLWS